MKLRKKQLKQRKEQEQKENQNEETQLQPQKHIEMDSYIDPAQHYDHDDDMEDDYRPTTKRLSQEDIGMRDFMK